MNENVNEQVPENAQAPVVTLKQIREARKINEENLKDLRQRAEYERLMYEIAHYQLLAQKDFLERESIRETFIHTQEIVRNRIEAAEKEINDPTGEQGEDGEINLEN